MLMLMKQKSATVKLDLLSSGNYYHHLLKRHCYNVLDKSTEKRISLIALSYNIILRRI